MPSEKRGTVIEDLESYGPKEEKGVELKFDSEIKTENGALLKIVVGKVSLLLFTLTGSSNKTTIKLKQI